jgi:hypothetical protein
MKNQNPGVELPIASTMTLPYVAVYRSSFPLIALLPIATLLIATGGMVVAPTDNNMMFAGFFLLDLLSFAAVALIALKTIQKKQKTGLFLGSDTDEFIEAVAKRYKVTLTETILYRLTLGGSTDLLDKNGTLKRIMLESNPEMKTTKLVGLNPLND